jgi:hypothetical protein
MGSFSNRPTEGGFASSNHKFRTCQHSSGCDKPVTKQSYCDVHYAACYKPAPAKNTSLPRTGYMGKVAWGGSRR